MDGETAPISIQRPSCLKEFGRPNSKTLKVSTRKKKLGKLCSNQTYLFHKYNTTILTSTTLVFLDTSKDLTSKEIEMEFVTM
ncbi:hypothetical protein MSG28_004153 [Choristoneura fumiferana]|uniref:Uncharacterized protein n=1 Tax=Choristoneura fumiferana TaxID=7141 RepID=A0ACC0KHQ2_CHOFU|nr:hypothetical protein MSG28_004153 [Choristoneura fumiferana]